MRRGLFLIAGCLWLAGSLTASARQSADQRAHPSAQPSVAPPAGDAVQYRALVAQYCVSCHNPVAKTGGLILDPANLANVAADPELWEKVVRKLQRGAMPPQGARRPDPDSYHGLVAWLETELDRAAAAHPNPGRPLPHRLNRAEYANAIRDLLAVDVGDVDALLPADDSAYGFDNIADALGVSSVLLERYVSAAGRISALAVGDPDVAAGSETYIARQDLSQDQHIEGLPFGTVGGMLVHHTFPLDGEYELQATLLRTNVDQIRGLEHAHQIEFAVDGERVFLIPVGGDAAGAPGGRGESNVNTVRLSRSDAVDATLHIRLPIKAGPRTLSVAFLERALVENSRRLQPFRSSFDTYDATGLPHIRTLRITGPFHPTGPGDTPSRRRIFMCRPANPAGEEACATRILTTLGGRAYRGDFTPIDAQHLLEFYRAGRAEGTFETGVERGLQRILASPKFVLRVEHDPANVAAGVAYPISDLALASRLSFFLWSSLPDDELLQVAGQGKLKTASVLEQQVRRMLADPRAAALTSNFAGQWLQLRNLRNAVPDSDTFPDFDDNLRQAFQRETELLFANIMHGDRSVVELLTADYTFVNERLARHYGIPYIYGSQFRRVAVTDEARKGLLGHGSILTLTSNANRTSPVVRGKWILSTLLGMPPSPPPPNVPPLKDNSERATPLSMREQMEEHRKNPPCAGCHKIMDPLGFALENFDAVGAWRDRDAGRPIDASGELVDGTHVDGVVALRHALVKRPDVFVATMTEKLLTYALGRGVESYDMPAVRTIVRQAAAADNRFSSLVLGIARSTPFQQRIKPLQEEEAAPIRSAAR